MNKGLIENLKTLIVEVKKQILATQNCLINPQSGNSDKIFSTGNYVDNLKNIILKKAYSSINDAPSENHIMSIMSINTVATNLEKIGDLCESISKQTRYISDNHILTTLNLQKYFTEIVKSVDLIENSFFSNDTKNAVKICRSEFTLDVFYKEDFVIILEKIKSDKNATREYLALYTIIRYLERIGDALQNIGEAIISSATGARLKIYEYDILSENSNGHSDEISLEDIGVETKSGCRIEKLHGSFEDFNRNCVIYKEGANEKLKKENTNLKIWSGMFPDLVPKTYGYIEKENNAVLLIQYIDAINFHQLIVSENDKTVFNAVHRLFEKCKSVWDKTKKDTPTRPNFAGQALARIEDVVQAHPEFKEALVSLCGIEVASVEDMLTSIEKIENNIFCPFSVLTHGDFNTDNILYNKEHDRIYFIDLFRSEYGDYVQDVSVLIVSYFRNPIPGYTARTRIENINRIILEKVRNWASSKNDADFETRLTLGVARSLLTSTRFTFEKDFAKEMFMRSKFLLEKIHSKETQNKMNYVFPEQILTY